MFDRTALDIEPDFSREASRRGYHLELTSPTCPVQVEGDALGRTVYYRARHGQWDLHLGEYDCVSGVGEPDGHFVLEVLDAVKTQSPFVAWPEEVRQFVCRVNVEGERRNVCHDDHGCREL